mmetsp:Transcript_62814/g.99624  ORF Transcript_62814/g.99624 Transcript_62814/m.99624 type:complete len:332 (-) Transcript_62814:50-1045(-)
MSSYPSARYGSSAAIAFFAYIWLIASGDQVHVHSSASMTKMPHIELDSAIIEDGLGDQDDLSSYQDGFMDERKAMRARAIPAASTIMRRHAEASPFDADDIAASEVLENMKRSIRPHLHSPSHVAHARPASPIADAPAPAAVPGNVELTLSWREPREELPALLAEVARARKQESNSGIANTPAPAADQDVDLDTGKPAPSPMPKPSGDSSTKGLPLFIFTVIVLCCCCGCIGSCVWYLCIRKPTLVPTAGSAPLLGNQAESTAPSRSYRERRVNKNEKKTDGEGGDKPPEDEAPKGETGGSTTGETGGSTGESSAKPPETVKVQEEEEQHF